MSRKGKEITQLITEVLKPVNIKKTYCVYALVCPIEKVIKYIGATKQPHTRYKQHFPPDTYLYGSWAPTSPNCVPEWIIKLFVEHKQVPQIFILAESNNLKTISDIEDSLLLSCTTIFKIRVNPYYLHKVHKISVQ